eukprot:15457523-Alexandrium_andersonii.AAC.1
MPSGSATRHTTPTAMLAKLPWLLELPFAEVRKAQFAEGIQHVWCAAAPAGQTELAYEIGVRCMCFPRARLGT